MLVVDVVKISVIVPIYNVRFERKGRDKKQVSIYPVAE